MGGVATTGAVVAVAGDDGDCATGTGEATDAGVDGTDEGAAAASEGESGVTTLLRAGAEMEMEVAVETGDDGAGVWLVGVGAVEE